MCYLHILVLYPSTVKDCLYVMRANSERIDTDILRFFLIRSGGNESFVRVTQIVTEPRCCYRYVGIPVETLPIFYSIKNYYYPNLKRPNASP